MAGGSFGSMVVRLALQAAGYKAGLNESAADTERAASRIEGAAERVRTASRGMGGALGDGAEAALQASRALGIVGTASLAAAVGIGGAAYAAYQGAKEQQAYQQAIIMTGNVSGTTASQMQGMAAGIDKVVGTQAQASAALVAMASTGQVAGVNLQGFAQVAIETERVVGTTVDKTAQVFAQLGEAPVKASIKLNESMNYLTAATFAQIKAADELGDHEKAASLAQEAYATAMHSRTEQIKGNLGTLEKAWMGVRDFAKDAWDSMLGLGRPADPSKQLDALSQKIAEKRTQLADKGLASNFGGTDKLQAELNVLLAQQGTVQEIVRMGKIGAQHQAESVALEKAKIAWMQEGDKYLSKEEQLEQKIAKIKTEGRAAGAEEADILKRINIEREKAATKPKADNSAQRELEKEAALLATLSGVNADYQDQLGRLQRMREKGNIGEAEYIQLLNQLIAKQPMAKKLIDDTARASAHADKQMAESNAEYVKGLDALDKSIEKLTAETEKELSKAAALGLTKIAAANLAAVELERDADAAERLANKQIELGLEGETTKKYQDQAKALRDLAAAKRSTALRETEVETEKEIATERKRGWEETDRLARDVFTNQEVSAKRLGDVLRTALKSAIYEVTLKPIAFQLYTSVTGGGGAGGALQAASSAGNASSLLGSVGSALGAFGSSAASAASAVWGGAGVSITNAVSTGIELALEGSFAQGAGMISGALGPVVLGLTALNSAMQYTVDAKGSALVANVGGGNTVVANRNDYQQTGGLFGGGTTNNSDWSAASAETTAYFDAQVKAVTEAARAYGTALGLPVGDLDAFKQQIEVSLTGLNADQAKEAINRAVAGFGDAMVSANFGTAIDSLKRAGETSSATLVRVATQITAVNGTLGVLGGKLLSVDAAGIKAADGLVQAMGGLEAFQQQTSSYYQNFYSAEEQRLQKAKDVQARLAQGGIDVALEQVLDVTKDQFRQFVDGFVNSGAALTTAGQAAIAALMAVQGAVSEIATASPTSQNAASTTAPGGGFDPYSAEWYAHGGNGAGTGSSVAWSGGGASEAVSAAVQERKSLQDELDSLIMTSTELLQKQRDALDESNRALWDQVQAAKAAKAVAEEHKTLQEQYNQLTMTELELRALERESIAESNRELFDRITALKAEQEAISTAISAADTAFAAVQRAIDAEKRSVEATRQAAQERVNIIGGIVNTLGGAIDDLRGNVDGTQAAAAARGNAFITDALATAKASGYLPDPSDLKDAIADVRKSFDVNSYATQFEYEKAQLVLAGKLEGLKDVADPQLTAAKAAVTLAEAQLKALDGQLQAAKESIDALHGIDNSVQTVSEALAALAAAIGAAEAAGAGGTSTGSTGTTTTPGQWIGQTYGGLSTDFWKSWGTHMQNVYGEDAGYKVYNMAIERGVSASELEQAMGWSAGHANAWATAHGLASFDVGTNYVPRDMLALVHEGEEIKPKRYNPAAGGVSGNARLELLLETLTQQFGGMVGMLEGVKDNTGQLAEMFDTVTEGGNAMRRGTIV